MNSKRIEAEHIFDWTQSRTNEIEKLPKMTFTQKGKVFEKKKSYKDRFLSSDAVQSIINDKKMG